MRISLFGGPGVGKTTLACRLFSDLKLKGLNIELISEYIKTWAYEKRELKGCDQFYIFAKQWRKEDIILRNGVEHLVTDSPILLGAAYSNKYQSEGHQSILDTALSIEHKGDSDVKWRAINIFLERVHGEYRAEEGRWQDLEGAKELDAFIKDFMRRSGMQFDCVPNDPHILLGHVLTELKKNGVKV